MKDWIKIRLKLELISSLAGDSTSTMMRGKVPDQLLQDIDRMKAALAVIEEELKDEDDGFGG